MIRETVSALAACLVTFVVCAVAYPAAVWGLGQAAFPSQAEGSLIRAEDGTVIGSELIAQPFASDKYFFPRPSAVDYKADATGGSNLGTKNPDLRKKVIERAEALKATTQNPVPADMVTASGGGMDPDISPEAAYYQAPRVAAARKLPLDHVRALIDKRIERVGIIGAPPRVNVLLLNLALDKEQPGSLTASSNVESMPEVTKATVAANSAPSDPTPKVSASVSKPDVAPSAVGHNELAEAVASLSSRMEKLQERVEAGPSEIAAELKNLHAKVTKLAEGQQDTTTSIRKVSSLGERVSTLESDLQVVRSDLKGAKEPLPVLRSELDSLREEVKKIETTAPGGIKTAPAEPDLSPAIKLFQGKQYVQAAGAFRGLTRTYPDDARVWYYAALANGLTTNQWRGETEELAKKGAERERAGTPASNVIDSTFASLTKDTGREWLAFYRQGAIKR
ncbi:MAG TPA: potassium-transporting ATPase subunit KdpC [Isosphaeraceae bacterium]|jgi:K+-transporting ATPase ATPase C chain|nr:potassium-transporting ATPase subunit KdpC [Isosphaeraceae bacterium]